MHGYLAYGWSYRPGTEFYIDTAAVDSVELTPPLLDAASVVVEPYVSSRSEVTTESISIYARGRLIDDPRRGALEQLLAHNDEQQQLWAGFTAEIRNSIVEDEPPAIPEVMRYREATRRMHAAYEELHRGEVAKLDAAIDRVLALRQS